MLWEVKAFDYLTILLFAVIFMLYFQIQFLAMKITDPPGALEKAFVSQITFSVFHLFLFYRD